MDTCMSDLFFLIISNYWNMESIDPTKSTYSKLWGFSTIFGFSDIGNVSFMLEKTWVPWKKYHFQFQWYRGCKWQPVVGHWQTLSHEVVSNTPSQGRESSTQPLHSWPSRYLFLAIRVSNLHHCKKHLEE